MTLPQLDVQTLPGPETITRHELANGIVLLVRENFSSPSVVVSGYLRVGSIDETRDQAGLAELTGSALMRGTQQRSFDELYEALESIGASIGFRVGKHTTSLAGKSLTEDVPGILNMLAEVICEPAFPPDQIERLRAEKLTELAIREQDTGSRAQLAFDERLYADHPYGFPSSGYVDTIRALTVGDIRQFHQSKYSPRGMILAVVGGLKAEAAIQAVQEAFSAWDPRSEYNQPELPPLSRRQKSERQEVYLAGKLQCDLVMGAAGPPRKDPNYLAAALGNNVLGRFGMMGRIGEAVRESAGLAYYAYSNLAGGFGPGPWSVIAGVNPANVDQAIQLIETQVRKYLAELITEEELSDSQANFIGRLPLQMESNEGVANSLIHMETYQLGLDYYQRFPTLISQLARQEIMEVSRQYLDPDRFVVAIAGPIGEETIS